MDSEAQTRRGDAAAIIEAVQEGGEFHEHTLSEMTIGVLPKDKKVISLKQYIDEYAKRPDRREGVAQLESLGSLIDHANRFKDVNSALFATTVPPTLTTVFDYHEQGEPEATARFRKHRGVYRFPYSEEWETWNRVAEYSMSQEAFAELLEDRIDDIVDPSTPSDESKEFVKRLGLTLAGPAKLLTLSRGLSIKVDSKVSAYTNPSSGRGSITWEEEHSDEEGDALEIPGGFFLGIPVFKHGEMYSVPVRLRYRVRQKQVAWILKLHRIDAVFRDAFERACKDAQAKTELPLFFGAPE